MQAHCFAGVFHPLRKVVVFAAGTGVSAGMVVAQGYYGGVSQQGVLYGETYVYGGLGNAAV